jgi:hemolysin activation/secretion protein
MLGAACAVLSPAAFAQQQPDAGRTIQEIQRNAPAISARSSLSIAIPATEKTAPGGPKVVAQSVDFHGNTIFGIAELQTALGRYQGQSYDLSGVKDLADRITAYYHAKGYPFARALIPAQEIDKGTLRIEIVEGRFGETKVLSDDARSKNAQSYLNPLTKGSVIENRSLERATLLIDDLPGYKATPIIRPGQDVGTGDLDVKLDRDSYYSGQVGIDNYGNRYTGRHRAYADFQADSPFMLGDQVRLNTLYTQEDMWYGTASYSLPVGISGLRAQTVYSHTYYELGSEFKNLDAHGTAKTASAGLSYPFIRSQKTNIVLNGTYQRKWLKDEQDSTNTKDGKSSHGLVAGMNFDRRDGFAGGGVTYGAVSWTHGVLNLGQSLKLLDIATAKTDGGFDKFNLDIARLQALPSDFSLFGRFSGQWATDNLDSSESFGLGGSSGVRAFPSGEGYGDEGWFSQIELRYQVKSFAPYVFYDHGRVTINQDPWAAGDNTRSIAGAGLGVRFEQSGWKADVNAAWRTLGGAPESDSKKSTPMIGFNMGYRF